MNNSDFLSDAVALNLGKSGVKVAETLEIEVGDEWWRLINAADVTDALVYQGRRENTGAISGGKLKLGSFEKNVLRTSHGWDTQTENFMKIHTAVVGETNYYYAFTYDFTAAKIYFRVWTNTEELLNLEVDSSVSSLNLSRCKGAYYDSVNGRILCGYYLTGKYYIISTGTSGTTSSLAANSSDFWTTEVFPECPEIIYSFFFSSAGGAKVKKITPQVGDNTKTQFDAVCSNAGATTLTAIMNYSMAGGLHPFYMRAVESVGVAWVDATSGQIGYVLESESWGTVRYLPNLNVSGQSLIGFGSTFFPLDGEFFLAAYNGVELGNVVKDTGYAFPANFVVTSFFLGGEDTLRIFGLVGTTLYGYTLTISTMALHYLGVADSSWSYGARECTKVGEAGDLDLLVFHNPVYTNISNEVLVAYNRSTNAIVWKWSDFASSTIFPYTYLYSVKNGSFFRFDDYLLVYHAKVVISKNLDVETIVVSIADILSCANATAVGTLLQTAGSSRARLYYASTFEVSGNSLGVNACLTGMTHDDSFFYFAKADGDSQYTAWAHFLRISKTDRTAGALVTRYRGWCQLPYSPGSMVVASGAQSIEGSFLYRNRVSDLTTADNLIRVTCPNEYPTYPWTQSFWDTVNAMTTPKNTKLLSYMRATTILLPAVEEKGEMATYTTYGTKLSIMGSSWDLSNGYGKEVEQYTLPFSPIKAFVDERNGVALYFGAIASGELPFAKHSAREGRLKSMLAIRISDTAVFQLDPEHFCPGGLACFAPSGSFLNYRTISGVMHMVNTGAALTDGIGGGIGGGSTVGLYVYDYLSKEYIPYPFAREGIRAELSNISKTTKITLPETQDHLIRGLLAAGTDFRGSRCIIRRMFPDHAEDAGSDIVLLDGYIQDWSYVPEKAGIAFTVSKTLIDVGGQFPKRLMNMGCSHVFKGERCQYLGEEGRCLKTKTFCTSLENDNQFGGFPWVAARQRRVMWK